MKYTSTQVNGMSYSEWMNTIANELNQAGYRARGYNEQIGRWQDNYAPYEVGDEPEHFFLGTIRDVDALEYLKSIGLVNNGRCPMCGAPIQTQPGRFTSGFNPNFHFQICQNCASKGAKSSMNPANGSGCFVALLLMPWYMIKGIFAGIMNMF